jgi:hypothetical protein
MQLHTHNQIAHVAITRHDGKGRLPDSTAYYEHVRGRADRVGSRRGRADAAVRAGLGSTGGWPGSRVPMATVSGSQSRPRLPGGPQRWGRAISGAMAADVSHFPGLARPWLMRTGGIARMPQSPRAVPGGEEVKQGTADHGDGGAGVGPGPRAGQPLGAAPA